MIVNLQASSCLQQEAPTVKRNGPNAAPVFSKISSKLSSGNGFELNVFHALWLRMSCLNDFPAAVIPTHDLTIFGSTPGQYYTSDEQCRLLLFDKRATRDYRQALSVNTHFTSKMLKMKMKLNQNQDICTSLRCQTPSRRGTFSSGPAVEGTTCGQGKWCRGGRCVPTTYGLQLPFSPPMDNQWWDEECKSGCVNRSIGKLTANLNTWLILILHSALKSD